MPAGRPTKYKPEMCAQLVDAMAEGFSKEAAAAQIGVAKQRLYDWAEKHEEFRDAIKEGEQRCLNFWEGIGIQGVRGHIEGFNASAWIFNMKNRAHWRDRQDVTSGDQPISINVNLANTDD